MLNFIKQTQPELDLEQKPIYLEFLKKTEKNYLSPISTNSSVMPTSSSSLSSTSSSVQFHQNLGKIKHEKRSITPVSYKQSINQPKSQK